MFPFFTLWCYRRLWWRVLRSVSQWSVSQYLCHYCTKWRKLITLPHAHCALIRKWSGGKNDIYGIVMVFSWVDLLVNRRRVKRLLACTAPCWSGEDLKTFSSSSLQPDVTSSYSTVTNSSKCGILYHIKSSRLKENWEQNSSQIILWSPLQYPSKGQIRNIKELHITSKYPHVILNTAIKLN